MPHGQGAVYGDHNRSGEHFPKGEFSEEDELFFERAEAAMQEDEKMRAFALHRLLADNVGAVVE